MSDKVEFTVKSNSFTLTDEVYNLYDYTRTIQRALFAIGFNKSQLADVFKDEFLLKDFGGGN